MIILYHGLPALTSNSLLLSSRQILIYRWVYYIIFSHINQGVSLVYHQFREKLHIISTKCCISSLRKRYKLRLMIYACGDDIHAKAWWYAIAFAMDKQKRNFCLPKVPFLLVQVTGFEPTRISSLEPETSASAVPPHLLFARPQFLHGESSRGGAYSSDKILHFSILRILDLRLVVVTNPRCIIP